MAVRFLAAAALSVTAAMAALDALAASGRERWIALSQALRPFAVGAHRERARLDPANAAAHLRRALAYSPRRTDLRLRLAETLTPSEAEAEFLRAARWDRGFEPAWRLANRAAEGGRRGEAWQWLTRAARVWRGEPGPLFRLAALLEPGASGAAARAGAASRLWPGDAAMETRYMDYLVRTGDPAAYPLGERLAARESPEAAPVLAALLARGLAARERAELAPVWERLAVRGWLSEAGPFRLTERWPAGAEALEWRLEAGPEAGIQQMRRETPPAARDTGLRIAWSGRQPERLRLACRSLWLRAGRYRIRGERPAELPPGLSWSIAGPRGAAVRFSPAAAAGGACTFEVNDGSGEVLDICLNYERPAGEVRSAAEFRVPAFFWERTGPARP
jgi:hypothetical protein